MIFYSTKTPQNPPRLITVNWRGHCYQPILQHAGLEKVPHKAGRRSSKPHADKFYHIILYVEGSGRFFWHDRLHPFQPGTAVLSWPGIQHHFHSSDGNELAYLEVTFSLEDDNGNALHWPFEKLLSYYFATTVTLTSGPWKTSELYHRKLKQNLAALPRILYSEHKLRWVYAFQYLFEILTSIGEEAFESKDEFIAEGLGYRLAKIRDYIERNFNQSLEISQLAEDCNLSVGHFLRSFKSKFGFSPLAYQQDIRLKVAENLLSDGEYRVAEVARRVGYSNPYYFSRLFRKRRGIPPREFGNLNNIDAAPPSPMNY
ncbi:MAG: helix-turn-helix domain-containing protein [Lentisphaeria bacterium]